MPQRDPDGTWNWGPLEGVWRGLMAAGRDFGNQIVGNTGPAGENPSFMGRLINMGAAGSTPASLASPITAMANARNGAIAGNQRGPTAPNTGADPRITGSRPAGSVVARGRADRSGLGPTAAMVGPSGRPRGGLMGGSGLPASMPTRDPNYRMPGTGGRAEQMPVGEYRAQMPELVRPSASGGARSNDNAGNENGNGPSRLGMGQLGRGGDEALNAASRSMFNRRGTQAEM